MDVSQVVQLADWFQKHILEVTAKYAALVSVLQSNSQQANLLPVAPSLDDLSGILSDMPTSELSILQLRVLDGLEVAHLLGKSGRAWINRSIRTSTFDPATTYRVISDANEKLAQAGMTLSAFKTAAAKLGFQSTAGSGSIESADDLKDSYVFNIIFQQAAAIKNVRDWKKTASDWELIITGVTAVANETPEDVVVVGAQNGSIIFTLSAAPIVTKILATISKHIAGIANDYLDFQIKREELRRSRMMSDAIENDFKRQEGERRTSGELAILTAVKAIVPEAKDAELEKLKKAIQRHITFSENGGEVDFVLPAQTDQDSSDQDHDLEKDINDIRKVIQDYQAEVQKTKLLTYVKDIDGQPEDIF